MNRARFGDLEVICRAPAGAARPTPLLFVHGAYTAAWCWDENFLPWFAEQGYAAYAVSLSGHGASRGRAYLDSFSIADYVADVAEVADKLPSPPVLIGHSMGGMVIQKYLEKFSVPGAVLMSSVPPQGLLGSAFGLAFSKPHLLGDHVGHVGHVVGDREAVEVGAPAAAAVAGQGDRVGGIALLRKPWQEVLVPAPGGGVGAVDEQQGGRARGAGGRSAQDFQLTEAGAVHARAPGGRIGVGIMA